MMPNMTLYRPSFRQTTLTDLEDVLDLIQDYYTYDAIPFDADAIRPALAELLNDPSLGRVWLIQVRAENIGYMVLTFGFDFEFGGRVGTVTDLHLKTSYRGQGLGRAAFTFIERRAASLGINAIELQTIQDNTEVLTFYTKLGFERHDRVPLIKRLKSG